MCLFDQCFRLEFHGFDHLVMCFSCFVVIAFVVECHVKGTLYKHSSKITLSMKAVLSIQAFPCICSNLCHLRVLYHSHGFLFFPVFVYLFNFIYLFVCFVFLVSDCCFEVLSVVYRSKF